MVTVLQTEAKPKQNCEKRTKQKEIKKDGAVNIYKKTNEREKKEREEKSRNIFLKNNNDNNNNNHKGKWT